MTDMHICAECLQLKESSEFMYAGRKRPNVNRLATRCIPCRRTSSYNKNTNRARASDYYREHRDEALAYERKKRENDTSAALIKEAKVRAKKYGLPFDLCYGDVQVPDVCPVLGMRLQVNSGKCGPDSPSLDRVVPERGYTKGNVLVVSHRANTIKSDATVSELRAVVAFYEDLILDAETNG